MFWNKPQQWLKINRMNRLISWKVFVWNMTCYVLQINWLKNFQYKINTLSPNWEKNAIFWFWTWFKTTFLRINVTLPFVFFVQYACTTQISDNYTFFQVFKPLWLVSTLQNAQHHFIERNLKPCTEIAFWQIDRMKPFFNKSFILLSVD